MKMTLKTTWSLVLVALLALTVGPGCGDDSDSGGEKGGGTLERTGYYFEGEEVVCALNTSFQDQESILAGGKNNPTGRGEQSGVFDPCNNRVILFGGNDLQPEACANFGPKRYLSDTWAYSLEYQNWYRIPTENGPSDRGRHAYAFDKSRKQLVIFGGRFRAEAASSTDPYEMFNDTWAFDVNTDTWAQLPVTGDIPSARINTGMVYDEANDQMILFGGNSSSSGASFTPLDDTYTLNLKTNVWKKHSINGPTKRLYHAMAYDKVGERVIVYSGGDENAFIGDFYTDLWSLNIKTMEWSQLNDGTGAPLGRINASLMVDDNGRILLFAGHDDGRMGNTNDIWAFQNGSWSTVQEGDVYSGNGCTSFCSCPADFVEFDFASPERRQYATLVKVEGENRAIMFGGTGDCGYIDDTWEYDLDTDAWAEVQAPEQGIACERTGREDCTELCY